MRQRRGARRLQWRRGRGAWLRGANYLSDRDAVKEPLPRRSLESSRGQIYGPKAASVGLAIPFDIVSSTEVEPGA